MHSSMNGHRNLQREKISALLSCALYSLPHVQLFQDALVSDVAVIAVDWIARHLYFALKASQDGTQIFRVDLEYKVKSPRELKICKRRSAIISFAVYPPLRYEYLYYDEIDIY